VLKKLANSCLSVHLLIRVLGLFFRGGSSTSFGWLLGDCAATVYPRLKGWKAHLWQHNTLALGERRRMSLLPQDLISRKRQKVRGTREGSKGTAAHTK